LKVVAKGLADTVEFIYLLYLASAIVVLKLLASCRWNCGLDKLSTILEMKIWLAQEVIAAGSRESSEDLRSWRKPSSKVLFLCM
jgi:hypothetical protein